MQAVENLTNFNEILHFEAAFGKIGAKECFFVLLVTTLGHHSKLVKVITVHYFFKMSGICCGVLGGSCFTVLLYVIMSFIILK